MVGLCLYLLSSSLQYGKNDSSGTQSSSRIMPSGTDLKNQVMAPIMLRPHPLFLFRKKYLTSHFHEIDRTIARASLQRFLSEMTPRLGPSAAINSVRGRIFLRTAKTFRVVSGLLKMTNNIGVSNIIVQHRPNCFPQVAIRICRRKELAGLVLRVLIACGMSEPLYRVYALTDASVPDNCA